MRYQTSSMSMKAKPTTPAATKMKRRESAEAAARREVFSRVGPFFFAREAAESASPSRNERRDPHSVAASPTAMLIAQALQSVARVPILSNRTKLASQAPATAPSALVP